MKKLKLEKEIISNLESKKVLGGAFTDTYVINNETKGDTCDMRSVVICESAPCGGTDNCATGAGCISNSPQACRVTDVC